MATQKALVRNPDLSSVIGDVGLDVIGVSQQLAGRIADVNAALTADVSRDADKRSKALVGSAWLIHYGFTGKQLSAHFGAANRNGAQRYFTIASAVVKRTDLQPPTPPAGHPRTWAVAFEANTLEALVKYVRRPRAVAERTGRDNYVAQCDKVVKSIIRLTPPDVSNFRGLLADWFSTGNLPALAERIVYHGPADYDGTAKAPLFVVEAPAPAPTIVERPKRARRARASNGEVPAAPASANGDGVETLDESPAEAAA